MINVAIYKYKYDISYSDNGVISVSQGVHLAKFAGYTQTSRPAELKK